MKRIILVTYIAAFSFVCIDAGIAEPPPPPPPSTLETVEDVETIEVPTTPPPPSETYVAYIPKVIRPGFPISISVSILDNQQNAVNVHANIMSGDGEISIGAFNTIAPGSTGLIEFNEQVSLDYEGTTRFNVTIYGVDTVTNEDIFRNTTSQLRYELKSFSVFIQSDKGIYQPGQTIKFRALIVNSKLMPFSGPVTYSVTDSSGNIVLLESDVTPENGIIKNQYEIPKRASGNHNIKVKVHNFEESISVRVYEYKLPKFSVQLTPDSFVHPKSQGLSVNVKGVFTFGQPVKGNAFVEVFRNRYCAEKQSIKREFRVFDGDEDAFFPIKQLKDVFGYSYDSNYVNEATLSISASVTDENSGETFTETKTVELKRTHIKITKLSPLTTIKPGLHYTAYIKVSQQDDTPISEEDRQSMKVETRRTINYPYNGRRWPSKKRTSISDIPVDGIIKVSMQAPNDNFTSVRFEPQIDGVPTDWRASWTASRSKSPSESFIQVTTIDSELTPGSQALVAVGSNIPLPKYKLDVLSRGSLIHSLSLTEPSFTFAITHDMTPNVQVVVSYVNPSNGEIIADSLKINVKSVLQNNVSISLSDAEVDAGNNVQVTVHAHPGSYVGLLAVDQSVLLLDKGYDVTEDRIVRDINRYDAFDYGGYEWGRWWWPRPSTGTDATEVFHRSGFEVLTDAFLYSQRWVAPKQIGQPGQPGFGGSNRNVAQPMAMAMESADFSAPPPPPAAAGTATAVRSDFPEAWIWDESSTEENGQVSINYKAPDTITTWELSSFALSDAVGLGVTKQNSKVTVFRNFFVQLNLPPKITRGEILIMQTTVFNYFDEDVVARVALDSNEWLELQEIDPNNVQGYERVITIPAKEAVAVIFPIKFIKVGRAPIQVIANCGKAQDALIRKLSVKPEGIMKTETKSKIIDRKNKMQPANDVSFPITIPDAIVEGSEYVTLYAYGDLLGSTLGNLGNLLQMPGGCGEQNMLSFAPDVFITLYLQKAKKLDNKIKATAYSHIRKGYSNQLTYKRYDGSYSAFGSSDRSGSTWLTAFVNKCFMFARELNKEFVQDDVLVQAYKFIIKQQAEDGVFLEPGRVIHSSMQGGVNSNITMTAYVLISMIENPFIYRSKDKGDTFPDDMNMAIIRAKNYLEQHADSLTDKYALAIVTYALKLAGSSRADDLFSSLKRMAVNEGSQMYWTTQERCVERNCYHSQSSDIEMTSYALLTYVQYGEEMLSEALPIVRWLVAQRNSYGGYYSTQDTVIAIQALSEIASLMSGRPQDITLIDSSTNSQLFSISDDNDIVLQSTEITDIHNDVQVEASGEGFAILQVTTSYNVPTKRTKNEPFNIDVTVKEVNSRKASLTVCTSINTQRANPVTEVGMFLVTVSLANGFTVDIDQARITNRNAKLIEMDGTDINLYYDTVGRKDQCFTLSLERFMEIARMKPQVITALEYYKPELVSYREYVIESLAVADVCDVCGSKCPECPAPAWEAWQPWQNYCGQNTQVRLCKDSNGDISQSCMGDHTRNSYQTPFSCPDFTHGLYIDENSAVYREAKLTGVITCKAPRGTNPSQNIPGLPSTYLNGEDQLIVCNDNIFKRLVTRDDGFTIAFLFHPKTMRSQLEYTVLSIGSGVQQPRILLSKPERSTKLEFKVLFRNYEFIVSNIPYDINAWRHYALTWSPSSGAKVYNQGGVVGQSSKVTSKTSITTSASDEFDLILGISHEDQRNTDKKYVKGLYNSLDVWSRVLPRNELDSHEAYYSSFIDVDDPFLSLAQVRHIVPESISGCMEKGVQASELKARSKQRPDWC